MADYDVSLQDILLHMSAIYQTAQDEGNTHMNLKRLRSLVERALHIPNRTLIRFHSTVSDFFDLLRGAPLRFMIPPPSKLCPIAKLPVELFSSILRNVVLDWEHDAHLALYYNYSTHSPSDLTSFLRTVTSVSRIWREIAFGTPFLWRNIFGEHGHRYGAPWHKALAFSGNVPLKVWGVAGYGTLETLRSLPFLQLDVRVESIHVMDRPHPHGRILPPFNTRTWTVLRSVSVVHGYGTRELRNMLRSFQDALSLKELRLSGFIPTDEGDNDPPVPLRSLEHLVLQICDPRELEGFISALLCPLLDGLVIMKEDKSCPSHSASLLDSFGHLRDRFPSLRALSLGGDLSAEVSIGLIVRLPHIRVLRMFNFATDKYLDHLTTSILYGGCLPYLQDLYIYDALPRIYFFAFANLFHCPPHNRSFRKIAVSMHTAMELLQHHLCLDIRLGTLEIWTCPQLDVLDTM